MTKKMTKRKMSSIGLLFPNPHDVVSDNFSYAKYIEDAYAFRKGLLQGYLEDFQAGPITLFDYKEQYLDNSAPYNSEKFERSLSRIGNLDINIYEKEISKLHDEFVARILAGEDLDTVDQDVSLKMLELATRNNDGTHNEIGYKQTR